MAMEDIVKQVSEALSKEGNSRVVFGEPMKLDDKVVIPVASVRVGGGGAAVSPRADLNPVLKALLGGGAGGAFEVRPVGFIHERGGEVTFTPIHLDVRGKPWVIEAASGLGKVFDSATHLATELFHRRISAETHSKGASR
jgi:uncharacterized spore protein YtfJ